MTVSNKFLISIFLAGFLWSVYKLFTSSGGGGLEDFLHGLAYTSIFLFVVSGMLLLFQLKRIGDLIDELIIFCISGIFAIIYGVERFF